jgi:hypothetical protein
VKNQFKKVKVKEVKAKKNIAEKILEIIHLI